MTIYNLIACFILLVYCIYVVIYEKRSIKSDLIEKTVKLSRYKTIISDEKLYDKYIEKVANTSYKLPNIKFKCEVIKGNYGIDYYIFNKGKEKKVFYLHGGSYIDNPLVFHLMFLDDLAYNTDSEVIFPIYPKAPHYNYKYSFDKVISLYNKLYKNPVTLMGDSAGGGFALALSTILKEKYDNINVIVLSPWLDITMENKNIKKYEKLDPFLSKKALIKAGKLWSNGDINNMTCPIYGDYTGVNITMFIGTHEIFLPDARKFKKSLIKQGVNINYYEYKYMNHVFPLYPIKEAKEAKTIIYDIIKKA